jgi:hypothetical protein
MIKQKSCKIRCHIANANSLQSSGYSITNNTNKRRKILNKAVDHYGKIEIIRRLYQLLVKSHQREIIKSDINYVDLMYFTN